MKDVSVSVVGNSYKVCIPGFKPKYVQANGKPTKKQALQAARWAYGQLCGKRRKKNAGPISRARHGTTNAIQFMETAKNKADAEQMLAAWKIQIGNLGGRVIPPSPSNPTWRVQMFYEDFQGWETQTGARRVMIPRGSRKLLGVTPTKQNPLTHALAFGAGLAIGTKTGRRALGHAGRGAGRFVAGAVRENPRDPWGPGGDRKARAARAQARVRAPAVAVDPDQVDELKLMIENDGTLYNQRKSIEENLRKKAVKGKYDPRLAPKLWLYWVDRGAREYAKRFGTRFSPAVRYAVAVELAREFEGELRQGNPGRSGTVGPGWYGGKKEKRKPFDSSTDLVECRLCPAKITWKTVHRHKDYLCDACFKRPKSNPTICTVIRHASPFGPEAVVGSGSVAECQKILRDAREQARAAGYGSSVRFSVRRGNPLTPGELSGVHDYAAAALRLASHRKGEEKQRLVGRAQGALLVAEMTRKSTSRTAGLARASQRMSGVSGGFIDRIGKRNPLDSHKSGCKCFGCAHRRKTA